MKKIFFAVCMMLLVGGCSNDVTLPVKSAEEVVKMIDNKESLILVVGSTTCDSCQAFKPVLKEYYKNYKDDKLVQLYIDNEDAVEVDGETKRVHYAELEERIGTVKTTPTTIFIENGEVKSQFSGNVEYDKLLLKIESAGFLPSTK